MKDRIDILNEIREDKNLDEYIRSYDSVIRMAVAQQGYGLEELKSDREPEVRAEVAKQGYALDKLTKDENVFVRLCAQNKLDQLNSHVAGYDIIARMDVKGTQWGDIHFALGHNPKAPSPYATWEADPSKGTYDTGHYFTDYASAFIDLTKRTSNWVDLGDKSIGMELLTEEDREQLNSQYRDSSMREDLQYALEDLIDYDGKPYDMDALLNDERFMANAEHRYYNIDHSAENEALKETMESLLEQFPEHKIETEVTISISPEETELINDILSKTRGEIIEKYGSIGSDLSYNVSFSSNLRGMFEIQFSGKDSDKPEVKAFLYHNDKVVKETSIPDVMDVTDLCVDWTYGDLILQASVQEDPALHRLGNEFIFHTDSTDPYFKSYDGKVCTIVDSYSAKNYNPLEDGLAWIGKFQDNEAFIVFDTELSLPREKVAVKEPLETKIQSAQSRIQETSTDSKDKAPER